MVDGGRCSRFSVTPFVERNEGVVALEVDMSAGANLANFFEGAGVDEVAAGLWAPNE